jgi:CDP-glucose 4,6-dehydratase
VLEPLCGYLLLAEGMWNHGEPFAQAWNFGPGDQDAIPVGEMATRIANLWGNGATWASGSDNRYREAMMLRVDASRARARLKWRTRLSIQDALALTVDWHKGVHDGRDPLELTRSQIQAYCDLEALA